MSRTRPIAAFALAALLAAAGAQAQSPDLARLHDALRLTPAQQDAWRDFVAASQPDAEQEARDRYAQSMMPKLTSPQRIDLSIAAMRADLQTMERRGAAVKAFYDTLTPAQQATFDRETAREQQ